MLRQSERSARAGVLFQWRTNPSPGKIVKTTPMRLRLLARLAPLLAAATIAAQAGQVPPRQPAPTAPPPGAAASQPPPATAMVLGRVVDAGTGDPIPGALVTITIASAQTPPPGTAFTRTVSTVNGVTTVTTNGVPSQISRQQTTNDTGAFVFHSLPPGTVPIRATAVGYAPGGIGQRTPDGPSRSQKIAAGERLTDVTIKLWRYGVVAGTVTDESGEPAVNVGVRLMRMTKTAGIRRAATVSSVQTDDRGTYRFFSILPGEYLVAVPQTVSSLPAMTVDAYLSANASPETRQNAQAITRALSESQAPSPGSAGPRFNGQQLQVGTGRLLAPPGLDGRPAAYRTVFYMTGDSTANATPVVVGSGQQVTNIDLQLRLVPTVKVSGFVAGPDGAAANLGVRLVPAGGESFESNALETAVTATDANGLFTFPAVPTGSYTLTALKMPRPVPPPPPPPPPPPGGRGNSVTPIQVVIDRPKASAEPTLFAEMPVSVGETDVTGLSIMLRTGARVRGRIAFEGSMPPPRPEQLQRMTVSINPLIPRPVSTGTVPVGADSQFTSAGLPPGRYSVSSGGPGAGWILKSIAIGGRILDDDALDVEDTDVGGVVITFTDRPTELSGTVTGSSADDTTDATVVIFPANYQPWIERGMVGRRFRQLGTGTTGTFRVANLPPGDYLVAAIDFESGGAVRDEAVIEKLAAIATRVTIGDGDKRTLNLSLGKIR
jgi:protocatechuate 3,4-dioxygenase beta subunit